MNKRGFTLIELIICIVILWLLIAMGVKFFRKAVPAAAAAEVPVVNPCDERNMTRYAGTVTKVQFVAPEQGRRYNLPLWFASIKKEDGTSVSAMLPGLVNEGEKVCILHSEDWDKCTDVAEICK